MRSNGLGKSKWRRRGGAVALSVIVALTIGGRATWSKSGGQDPASVRIGTNEVLLDLVVVDKKGRPVGDLRREEIEVSEDGVPQTIQTFRVVRDQPPPDAKPKEEKPGAPVVGEGSRHLVTMLFDRVTVQRVQAVRSAAFQFIDNSVAANMEVRVMVIGRRLWLIEQFTRDKDRMRRAVELATSTVEKSQEERSRQQRAELERATEGSGATAELARLSLDALQGSEQLEQEIHSPHHIFSLMPFARAHRLAPGRKMAIYFSDGLYLPPGLGDVLQRTISEANLANLSFYSINTRDLLVGAGNQVSRLETATVVNQTRRAESAAFSTDNANSFGLAFGSNRASTNFNTFEYIDRKKEMGKQGPLSTLTEGTGGFLILNSNDLNGALKKIGVELGNYYAISYTPTRPEFDGRFRTIAVRIRRPGTTARTRRGYFALPSSRGDRPELSYEAPLLAALNENIPHNDLPLDCGTFRFESDGGRHHVAIQVGLPFAPLLHTPEPLAKGHRVSFAVLGLVRNGRGEVIRQFSEPHDLTIPAAAADEVRRENFNLRRHFWLTPGEYTVEVGVHDIAHNRLATSRQSLRVSEPVGSSLLQTGDLLLVRQVDQLDAMAGEEEDPLVVGTSRIVPHLSREFEASGLTALSFTLPIFPGKTSAAGPRLKIELQRAGETVASNTPDLPPADATGRILFIASLGTEKLRPGRYQLHAVVTQGTETREESIEFTLNGEAVVAPANSDEAASNQGDLPGILVATDRNAELTVNALKSTLPATITIDTLLADLRRRGEDLHRVIGEYTYSLRKVRRTFNSRGRVRQEEFHDFEAYPINGRHALIKLAENGTHLDIRTIELNRRVATDLLIKNETTGGDGQIGYWGAGLDGLITRRGQHREWASISIDPEIFFEVCEFSSPRIVTLNERETIVVDLSPKAGAVLSPDREWIHRLTGTMWIDLADKTLVRIEAWKTTGGSPVTNFVYQQQILAPGVWAPALIRINSGGDETLFNGLNWDAWFEFTSFKKFDTSRIEQRIEPSPK